MRITELLERAGVALKHQVLAKSFVSMRQKKAHAEITFSTDAEMASQIARSVMTGKEPDYVGIVIWVPASAFKSEPGKTEEKAP